VLKNLMTYAERERKLIPGNPLKSITWTEPRKLKTVDPRCVINPEQARRFLGAVGKLDERGKRLKAFFGCMYYAALRPEEVTALRKINVVSLPEQDDEWGEFLLTDSQSRSGSKWSNDGSIRPRRELKHRAEGETRTVPIHPDLVKLLRAHIAEFGYGPGGRIFSLPRGGVVTNTAYLVIFHKARARAFTEAEAESPSRTAPVRPAPRLRVHLAQRHGRPRPGRRVGRPQRERADAGLRQVRLRPTGSEQAADLRRNQIT
jgi:integrase